MNCKSTSTPLRPFAFPYILTGEARLLAGEVPLLQDEARKWIAPHLRELYVDLCLKG